MKLTKNEKGQIQESLRQYVGKYPSQNKAAQSLTGTRTKILMNRWRRFTNGRTKRAKPDGRPTTSIATRSACRGR